MRMPFHLAKDCWVVFEDPYEDRGAELIEGWLESMHHHDRKPAMFTPEPLLTSARGGPTELRAHHEDVVRKALDRGQPVTVDGGPWRALIPTATAEALRRARQRVYGDLRPSLHVVFPTPSGGHARGVRELARDEVEGLLLLRPGHSAQLNLQIFTAMVKRHLYCTEVHA